jgi:hypothetical protein
MNLNYVFDSPTVVFHHTNLTYCITLLAQVENAPLVLLAGLRCTKKDSQPIGRANRPTCVKDCPHCGYSTYKANCVLKEHSTPPSSTQPVLLELASHKPWSSAGNPEPDKIARPTLAKYDRLRSLELR